MRGLQYLGRGVVLIAACDRTRCLAGMLEDPQLRMDAVPRVVEWHREIEMKKVVVKAVVACVLDSHVKAYNRSKMTHSCFGHRWGASHHRRWAHVPVAPNVRDGRRK